MPFFVGILADSTRIPTQSLIFRKAMQSARLFDAYWVADSGSCLAVCAHIIRGGFAFVFRDLRIFVQSWVITLLTYISSGTGAGLSFHSAFDCVHSVPIRFLFLIAWE